MRATALVSGGKDSIYAAHLAECQGFELAELLTVAPADPESMMFHTPHVDLVGLQAVAWGRPHRRAVLSVRGEAAEEAALRDALRTAPGEWVVAGAIASTYQYTRLLRIAEGLGRNVYAPLWGKPGLRVVEEEVAAGLDIRFVHLAAEGLPVGWLGRRLDREILASLAEGVGSPRAFHPAGEGGEYETLVMDAPFFGQRLVFDRLDDRRTGSTATLRIGKPRLVPKSTAGPSPRQSVPGGSPA